MHLLVAYAADALAENLFVRRVWQTAGAAEDAETTEDLVHDDHTWVVGLQGEARCAVNVGRATIGTD